MIKSRFLCDPLNAYGSTAEIDPACIGEISEDRSAIVGCNNWCFIYEGSNDYRSSYINRELSSMGVEWGRVIEARQSFCDRLGIKFQQVIVPNKATVLPECYPEVLPADVSFPLKSLLASSVDANLLIPLTEFRADPVREAIFRRNDSHLTVAGNALLTELIIDAVGIDLIGNVPSIEVCGVNHIGDLGGKFRVLIREELLAPRFDSGLLDQCTIDKTYEVLAGGFNGSKQSFHNPNAPIKQTILVFGNSFFERNPSWGLTPLFVALFENFHFIWSSHFIQDEVLSLRPDLVLSQTCERFMVRVPD